MSSYYILSLDGGGIRGILPAILLMRLEQAHPGFLAKFHLFAGTSTGGLLALGLAAGITPDELRLLYLQSGAVVFADTLLDDLKDIGMLIGADYSLGPLKMALTEQFGKRRLDSLLKRVLIASFDLDNEHPDPSLRTWKPKFFHNYPGADSDGAESIVDVALRTANAPVFFPIYQGCVDGGVVANNPSMCAVAQALNPHMGAAQPDELVVLSLGTGYNPRFVASQDGDWGIAQWAPHLIYLVLEGGSGLADYQCCQLLGGRYLRANIQLPRTIGMDKVEELPLLEKLAWEYDLSAALAWIGTHF